MNIIIYDLVFRYIHFALESTTIMRAYVCVYSNVSMCEGVYLQATHLKRAHARTKKDTRYVYL